MKKIIIVLFVVVILLLFVFKEDYYVVPNETIRFRIIANSNNTVDQFIKDKVKTALETSFKEDIALSSSIEETRMTINKNISNYEKLIKKIFSDNGYDKDFTINYGSNYFPEKVYQSVKYEEGYYELLLITIGNGKGDNFFCILFPPICMLEVEESSNIEYRFFIKDLFERYFD